jgi:hypothetical protein
LWDKFHWRNFLAQLLTLLWAPASIQILRENSQYEISCATGHEPQGRPGAEG